RHPARLEHAGHERHRLPARPARHAGRRGPGRRLLHDRERHQAHSGGGGGRRQRIHHEAVRHRHHPGEVPAGGAAVIHSASASSEAAHAPGQSGQPYRVMVVDDSAVIRGLIIRSLEADPQVQVVASVGNGRMAIGALQRHDIEIVVLDVEMPVMDGLTALPQLIAAQPGLKVIMASTLTRRNADISLRALRAGAADCLAKPSSSSLTTATSFKEELLAKVKALGESRRAAAGRALPSQAPRRTLERGTAAVERAAPAARRLSLRTGALEAFDALAIGSSTGGPQALFEVLAAIRSTVTRP